jgi:hypothetical protein
VAYSKSEPQTKIKEERQQARERVLLCSTNNARQKEINAR